MRYSKYPSYKDSGVEWLGEIPSDWNNSSFGYLCTFKQGIQVDPIEQYNSNNNDTYVRFLRISDYVNTSELPRFIKNPGKQYYVTKTDLNMIRYGSAGAGDVVKGLDGVIANNLFRLLFNKKLLYSDYLYFYLKQSQVKEQLFSGSVSSTMPAISFEQISKIKICLPDFQEQQTIANYLDIATAKIDTLIEKQTRLIELLKEKRQAVISTAVTRGLDPSVPMQDSRVEWLGEIPEGWEVSKLRYVFSFGKGLTITKANLVDKGIPCVNYGEIHSKYGFEVDADKHVLKCVDISYLKDSKSSLLSMGDFVFADTSEDIEGAGNFTHVSSEAQIFAGYHTVIARQVGEQSFRFLAYLIDSETFRSQIRLAVKGVKVYSITQAILRATTVWLPEIGEQQTIANYLDDKTSKIDNLITKSSKAIDLLKEKRTALISSAVTGKIDVRGMA